jgi:hypothetical protein
MREVVLMVLTLMILYVIAAIGWTHDKLKGGKETKKMQERNRNNAGSESK